MKFQEERFQKKQKLADTIKRITATIFEEKIGKQLKINWMLRSRP